MAPQQPKEIKEIKEFLMTDRRKDAKGELMHTVVAERVSTMACCEVGVH